MIPLIYFWSLLGVFAVFVFVAVFMEVRYKNQIKEWSAAVEASSEREVDLLYRLCTKELQLNSLKKEQLKSSRREQRLISVVRKLRKRQFTITRSMTWFKNADTDIRVLKVQAREQLAIDLENSNAIEYIISENERPEMAQTEITVKARIKILKLK